MSEPRGTSPQGAYEAYCEDAAWKNYRGDPCPPWAELREDICRHWEAVDDFYGAEGEVADEAEAAEEGLPMHVRYGFSVEARERREALRMFRRLLAGAGFEEVLKNKHLLFRMGRDDTAVYVETVTGVKASWGLSAAPSDAAVAEACAEALALLISDLTYRIALHRIRAARKAGKFAAAVVGAAVP